MDAAAVQKKAARLLLDDTLGELERAISDVFEKMTVVHNRVQELETRVNALEADQQQTRTDVEQLKDQVGWREVGANFEGLRSLPPLHPKRLGSHFKLIHKQKLQKGFTGEFCRPTDSHTRTSKCTSQLSP